MTSLVSDKRLGGAAAYGWEGNNEPGVKKKKTKERENLKMCGQFYLRVYILSSFLWSNVSSSSSEGSQWCVRGESLPRAEANG